jgi:uncharacterized Zn finger protein (UPF0148 family)
MAKLTCDICGGKLVVKSGGIAVCDNCGMEYSPERLKEKLQEEKDSVKKVDAKKIDNWMKMGTDAIDAGNDKEAYKFFTKVVEAEPNNWRAVFERGKAAASQSTIKKDRTAELSQAVRSAMQILRDIDMPKQELIDIKNDFAVVLYNINNEITDKMDEKLWEPFDLYRDKHWDLMWNTHRRYQTNIEEMTYALSLIEDYDDELSKDNSLAIKKRICKDINNLCYSIGYWVGHTQEILSYIGLSSYEKQRYLNKYLDLVYEIREIEPDFRTKENDYPDPFDCGYHPRNVILDFWKEKEAEYQEQKKREAQQKRNDEYWKEHAEEKKQYEDRIQSICAELKELKKTVSGYDDQISEIRKEEKIRFNDDIELSELKNKLSDMIVQKSKLGVLAFKQKKKIQEEIDTLKSRIDVCEKNILDDISSRISALKEEQKPFISKSAALEKEKKNIEHELTRDR